MALVLWLPHPFLVSCFINFLCIHVVFERPTEGGWHNLPGTASNSLGGWLEQVAQALGIQRQEKLSVNILQILIEIQLCNNNTYICIRKLYRFFVARERLGEEFDWCYHPMLISMVLFKRLVFTRMMRAILNKSRRQHPTKSQLYGHLPPITKTIQVRRTKDEHISDVLLWTPTYGRAKAGRPAQTCIQQLCEDTGCSPEDLLEAMNDREKWWEKVRNIRAGGTTWWWWWYSWKITRLWTREKKYFASKLI